MTYVLMGKVDESLASLGDAISLNDSLKEMAKAAPGFDKIKDDERFKKLVA